DACNVNEGHQDNSLHPRPEHPGGREPDLEAARGDARGFRVSHVIRSTVGHKNPKGLKRMLLQQGAEGFGTHGGWLRRERGQVRPLSEDRRRLIRWWTSPAARFPADPPWRKRRRRSPRRTDRALSARETKCGCRYPRPGAVPESGPRTPARR